MHQRRGQSRAQDDLDQHQHQHQPQHPPVFDTLSLNDVYRMLGPCDATAGFQLRRPRNDASLGAATIPFYQTAYLLNTYPVDLLNAEAALALNSAWAIDTGGDDAPLQIMAKVVRALQHPNPSPLAALVQLVPSIRVPHVLPVTGLAGIRQPSGPALVCLAPGCGVTGVRAPPTAMYRHVLAVHYTPALPRGEPTLPQFTHCFPHPNLYVLEYPEEYPRVWDSPFAPGV